MKTHATHSPWRCRCGDGRHACRVPPAPNVMAELYTEYRRSEFAATMSFTAYLVHIGFVDPSITQIGMDDGAQFKLAPGGPQLIAVPSQPVVGEVRVIVLLVDFPDRPGPKPREHYADLLFSKNVYPTGSMRDYYAEVSRGKVDISGTVHGWLRMPQPYAYYTNNQSGMKWNSYPNNAPRLAEDAVKAALAAGVVFDASLDKFGRGIVTALFIVHAGRGAEVMQTQEQRNAHIWSHKWNLRKPVEVASDLAATIYLTVPADCKVGVCAHELGHLAFEWQDFYDPNYDEDGEKWDGTGVWDLMAGGSHNGAGTRPAHPAALHKLQHGWIDADTVKASRTLKLLPSNAETGRVAKIVSPVFDKKQYLLLENRRRAGFDFSLPGEGLLVWKVDEDRPMEKPNWPGLSLIQADGRRDLEDPSGWNQGDGGDPFPGDGGHNAVGDVGETSTSFPSKRSGVTLSNIRIDDDGSVVLDVTIVDTGAPNKTAAVPKPAGTRAKRQRRKTPATV